MDLPAPPWFSPRLGARYLRAACFRMVRVQAKPGRVAVFSPLYCGGPREFLGTSHGGFGDPVAGSGLRGCLGGAAENSQTESRTIPLRAPGSRNSGYGRRAKSL